MKIVFLNISRINYDGKIDLSKYSDVTFYDSINYDEIVSRVNGYDVVVVKEMKLDRDLIYRFNKIHNFKYNYNDSKYLTIDTKIKIICPIHGEFWQTPYSHLQGCGCPKCNESKLEREIRMFLENEKID